VEENILHIGGLAWLDKWGSLRYASKTAFLAFVYGDWVKTPSKKERYRSFAEKQINYMLGSNPNKEAMWLVLAIILPLSLTTELHMDLGLIAKVCQKNPDIFFMGH
jgi:hypothetical protein